MIIVRLIGGLGNQLFQYALGRKLADRHQTELVLDISEFKTYTLRKYRLNHFNISSDTLVEDSTLGDNVQSIVEDKDCCFKLNALHAATDSYLIGYWQSEEYFKEIEPMIRQEFTVKYSPTERNAQLLAQIAAVDAVSIHIRRGDYVANPVTNAYHGVLAVEYYYRAIELINSVVANPYFYIFSDDIEWAKLNLKTKFPMYFVSHNGEEYDYEDLRLMSACKHHIIANSSFSWWGAWLNPDPQKIVVAPQKWFNVDKANIKELIPLSWKKIP